MPLVAKAPTDRVILGLMTFGPNADNGARITDMSVYKKVFDTFQARGYNEVDTAPTYVGGEQEAFTREAGWKERGFTLATKVRYPSEHGMNTADKVKESVGSSLKNLGTDCIDLLYLHRPDRGTPFAETFEALDQLHKAGKFVRLGISNFAAYEVAEVVMMCKYNGWVRPSVFQGMYNAITRNVEPELLTVCRRYGLDYVAYNPIAGGLFSGKIKSKDMVPESGRFAASNGTQGRLYRERYFKESTFKALQIIEKAVEQEGITMIETALRWMVHHSKLRIKDGNDGIIIGISSLEQLDSNLDNLEKGPLPDTVVKALDEAWEVSRQESGPYWHGELEYSYNTAQTIFGAGAK